MIIKMMRWVNTSGKFNLWNGNFYLRWIRNFLGLGKLMRRLLKKKKKKADYCYEFLINANSSKRKTMGNYKSEIIGDACLGWSIKSCAIAAFADTQSYRNVRDMFVRKTQFKILIQTKGIISICLAIEKWRLYLGDWRYTHYRSSQPGDIAGSQNYIGQITDENR